MSLKCPKTKTQASRRKKAEHLKPEYVASIVDVKHDATPTDEEDMLEMVNSVDPSDNQSPNKSRARTSSHIIPLKSESVYLLHNMQPTNDSCCALCLRKYQQGLFIKFSSEADGIYWNIDECETKLKNAVDLEIKLEHHVICRSCWSLVEVLHNFRVCCLRAEKQMERFTDGINDDPNSNSWLSDETMESICRVHIAIQTRVERIDLETLAKETPDMIQPQSYSNLDSNNSVPNLNSNQTEGLLPADVDFSNTVSEPVMGNIDISTCKNCLRRFDNKAGYALHIVRCKASSEQNAKAKTFSVCSICSASFESQRMLEYHLNKHKGIKPFECRRKCKSSFYSPEVRWKHEQNCGKSGRICEICGTVLKSKHSLANHMEALHGDIKLPCDICGYIFKNKKSLYRHKLVHSDVRKYPCNVCGKAFKTSYAANVHMRIHTQEKPFPCTLCNERFTYKCLLNNHIKRFHERME
ncbi:zinc finger protein 32-like [Toxorhynchites rutilus septentrionalis]|uniref:zinc finger protein 32-like n=1 Tax=Toxorhynchites rutilus septentrionalis TaxID=329112 RepID=UPI00247991C7|nr:zinc finger protein 32-like [Toxorhynchites rutilus septentrionalis]XP_055625923.1 zinc finger protein 32-like [Toxorhynchites rutilus septentrionalis]